VLVFILFIQFHDNNLAVYISINWRNVHHRLHLVMD